MGLFDRIRKFFRKAFGREYAEPSEEITEIPIPEKDIISKIVVFYERISGTRIRRKVKRAFAASLSDTEIQNILAKQYDMGGNFVIHVESISIGVMEPFSEEEIERGLPGSADK